MSDLLAARLQMAVSLGFHIIFAVIGIAMPALMLLADWRWLRRREQVYQDLSRQWARGTAIFFAVGAVSGTALSFELGLLWPEFMRHAGPIIGMPFSLEGLAFFTEAIFLGIYLYGFDRVPERWHFLAGVVVLVSGVASAVFVMSVNAWMNTPVGFRFAGGQFSGIDPVAAMFNPAWGPMTVHMVLASFVAVGFGVAGVHAWMLRRQPGSRFHRAALGLGLLIAAPGALLQLVSGDVLTRHVAEHQPVKFAALEGHFHTQPRAPLRLGGLPDADTRTVPGSIELPGALSFLAHRDVSATVTGLDAFPREVWPPLPPVRLAWQVMVAIGTWLAGIGALALWRRRRGPRAFDPRWFLTLLAASAPLGFIAIEAGWVVTEVGRQPWIVYGILRTADAVTPMPRLAVPFTAFTALYLLLAGVVAVLMWRMIRSTTH